MTTDELAQVKRLFDHYGSCVADTDDASRTTEDWLDPEEHSAAAWQELKAGRQLFQHLPALLAHIASLEAERDLLRDQLAAQDTALADAALVEERQDAECEALAVQMTSLEARNEAKAAVVAAARGLRRLPLFNLGRPWGAGSPEYAALAEAQDRLDAALDAQAGEVPS